MDPITVLIAYAHALLRQRLSRSLAQEDIRVVGEAADGRQVLSGVEALQPHILAGCSDAQVGRACRAPKIRAKSPGTKTLFLTDFFEGEFIALALQRGAQGCLLKTAPPTELVKAVRTTHAGEFWAPRQLLSRMVESSRQRIDELQGPLSRMPEVS